MSKETDFRVYFTQREDGTWLAASVSKPWFCLSAATEDDARAKAQRAINFWCENRGGKPRKSLARSVSPFAPSKVETLVPIAACA